MNRNFFTLIFLTIIAFSAYAQPASDEPDTFLEAPVDELMEPLIASNKPIKAIEAKEYRVYPSGAQKDNGTSEFFEFDSLGHLVKQVEIEKHDTSIVRDFFYTQTGFLNWEVYYDKEWDKKYKSGYRQNKDSTIFQVKSYEMLNDDASMLLDTRLYTYTATGKAKTIMSLENGQVIETRYYTYDEKDNLIKERLVDAEENETLLVTYEYNSANRLKNVKRLEAENNGIQEEFKLSYYPSGDLKETNWLVNDLLKGKVTYAYDDEGRLSKVFKDMLSDMGQQQIVKVYEYQFYEN